MRTIPLLEALGWIEAAVFALAAVATAAYVIVRVLVTAVRCGSVWRGLGLVGAAFAFLLGWAALVFAGVVVTMMAVVSDVQASPRGEEVWRHLTVLGVAAAVMVAAGWARRGRRSESARPWRAENGHRRWGGNDEPVTSQSRQPSIHPGDPPRPFLGAARPV